MTDKEALEAMLARAGIATDSQDPMWTGPVANEVYIEARGFDESDGPQRGWGSFYTVFTFDEDGALIQVGIWE